MPDKEVTNQFIGYVNIKYNTACKYIQFYLHERLHTMFLKRSSDFLSYFLTCIIFSISARCCFWEYHFYFKIFLLDFNCTSELIFGVQDNHVFINFGSITVFFKAQLLRRRYLTVHNESTKKM